ncbi:hypothetical protein K501DRAFT_275402 [Backusella circina FSU 941]|nr:hypothetical protein K501DRAFT_275402 [Backusella circina FSU 941]
MGFSSFHGISKITKEFLSVFEARSGTNVPVNEDNWNVPPEYLNCFNVEDQVMTEVVEESAPGLVDVVNMEWVQYTGPQTVTSGVAPSEPSLRRLMDLNYYKVHRSAPESMESVLIVSVRKAALDLGFAVRTAQHYCRQYRLDDDKVLPGKTPQSGGAPKKFFAEHTKFLTDFFDENVTGTLWKARDALCEKFELSVSLAAIHNHLVGHCTVTVKKLEKLPAARITPRVIEG